VIAPGPYTLSIDCGGSKLKATVLDAAGGMVAARVRVGTPYPLPPDLLVKTLIDLAAELPWYDRVSVGFPGMVRGGRVLATPHYITESGPFTPARPDLLAAWRGFDVQEALSTAFGKPTRVLNDAEVAGYAVIEGRGFEVMLTLGTGLGCALFDDGRLLPKLEVSAALCRDGESYDAQLGNHTRKQIGNEAWTARVGDALDSLHSVFWWDRLYLGGGNNKHLTAPLRQPLTIVPNTVGLLGGVRLWGRPAAGTSWPAPSGTANGA
jgi:polyphosphate glucokinase